MKTPVDEFNVVLDRLSDKVAELEARLSALEQRSAVMGNPSAQPVSATAITPAPLEQISLPRLAGALAAVGRFFLGIAGAYLLRALAESGVLPRPAVVAVALAYAVAWLVWAARARAATGFARAASAVTAALILSPMLWELTLRFQILPPWTTAAVLGGFVVLASALAWKSNLAAVAGLSTLAAAVTGLALLVPTRDPTPFMLALLVMALAAETAACRDRWLGLRTIAATAVDLGVLALILIYAREGGVSEEYKPVAVALLITMMAATFAIYGASTAFRSVILAKKISIFEIAQTAIAFMLAATGILRLSQAAAPALGIFCLLATAACYLAAFTRLARLAQSRSYHVFATWGGALFLTGSFLVSPVSLRAAWLAVAAVTATAIGIRWPRLTLSFHAAAFLAVAAFVSGLVEYAGTALAGGSSPMMPGWGLTVAAGAALVCYAIAAHSLPDQDPWHQRLLRLALATPAAVAIAALAAVPAAHAITLATPMSPPFLAAAHTLVACLVALALAFAGSRWKRIDLVWLAYAFIAFCTLKLLFEDLRSGSAGSIAASLFFCGMAWVLVPSLGRRSPRSLLDA
jgi:hypothetical protein